MLLLRKGYNIVLKQFEVEEVVGVQYIAGVGLSRLQGKGVVWSG